MREYNAEKHLFDLCNDVAEQIDCNQHQLDNMKDITLKENLIKLKDSNVILRNLLVNIFFYLKHPEENA